MPRKIVQIAIDSADNPSALLHALCDDGSVSMLQSEGPVSGPSTLKWTRLPPIPQETADQEDMDRG